MKSVRKTYVALVLKKKTDSSTHTHTTHTRNTHTHATQRITTPTLATKIIKVIYRETKQG